MTVPLPPAARAVADALAVDHRTDRSAVLTDICCYHYGRPDLMRHLSQQTLFESATTHQAAGDSQPGPHIKVRPPRVIADLIVADYQRRGMSRPGLLSDICCLYLGFPEMVRELHTAKEGLALAM